jgi:hypothetical protein
MQNWHKSQFCPAGHMKKKHPSRTLEPRHTPSFKEPHPPLSISPRLSVALIYAVSGRWPVQLDLRWGPTPTGRIPGSDPFARGAFRHLDSRLPTVIIYRG